MKTVFAKLENAVSYLTDSDSAPSMESRELVPELLESIKTAILIIITKRFQYRNNELLHYGRMSSLGRTWIHQCFFYGFLY